MEKVLRGEGLKSEEAAFVGDDLIDLPAMRACGLGIAVKNARAEEKREAHYVTPHEVATAPCGMLCSTSLRHRANGRE
jgi:3-deoxy-D-manno-octulosonate 8-phosphate phosphatase (KDO 8-P phosphatase)